MGGKSPISEYLSTMRVTTLLGAFVAPFVLLACATGVLPSDVDVGGGGGDGGLANRDGGFSGGDTGPSPTDDASTRDDTGTITNPDSGTPIVDSGPPVIDSGGTALHGGDCTRTTSTQFTPARSYDQVCDDYYFNTLGGSAPCTRGGTSCARFDGMAGYTTFCCYKPPIGSNCYFDYAGGAQCVPE